MWGGYITSKLWPGAVRVSLALLADERLFPKGELLSFRCRMQMILRPMQPTVGVL